MNKVKIAYIMNQQVKFMAGTYMRIDFRRKRIHWENILVAQNNYCFMKAAVAVLLSPTPLPPEICTILYTTRKETADIRYPCFRLHTAAKRDVVLRVLDKYHNDLHFSLG